MSRQDAYLDQAYDLLRAKQVALVVKTSLVAQTVKHLSTMQETWVQSLGWEDSLGKEMATHSSTLAQKIPRMEEPGVHGVPKSWTRLSDFTLTLSGKEPACQ